MNQKIHGEKLKTMFLCAANLLENNKEIVNSLNVFPVPDGDTGTNMSLTMNSAIQEMNKLESNSISEIVKSVSNGSLMGARGNSGVILSQILRGLSKSLENKETMGTKDLAIALNKGAEMAYKAVMKPVEGTILTIAKECGKYAMNLSNKVDDPVSLIENTIKHCEIVLKKTPDMLSILKEAGVVDAGGKGYIYILKGFLIALKEEGIVEPKLEDDYIPKDSHIDEFERIESIKYIYCTEMILRGKNLDIEKVKSDINSKGDSIVVIGTDEMVKIHIHTNHPGEIIEYCISYGELDKIKIENMKNQHQEFIKKSSQEELNNNESKNSTIKPIGIISIVTGDGIKDIFKSLGSDILIEGGQTMNPSTEDILKAIEGLNAEEIIILPNNSNIILASQQAKKISKKNVSVIPSKTIPQGLSAIMSLDYDENIEENIKNMTKAMSDIKTGEITYSVRSSTINGHEIKEGDLIGLSEGTLEVTGNNKKELLIELLEKMVDEDNEIITILYGNNVTESEIKPIESELCDIFKTLDVEIHYGGQPHYFFIISVE